MKPERAASIKAVGSSFEAGLVIVLRPEPGAGWTQAELGEIGSRINLPIFSD